MFDYKKCKCDNSAWEEIVVKGDEHFTERTVIYFHCDSCGEDFRVEDFETNEELFFPKLISS
jgi:hypothetical protein